MKINNPAINLLKKFDDTVVQHPKFMSVFDEIATHLQFGPAGRILVVVGPTGVGKTTMIRYLDQQLINHIRQHDYDAAPPLLLEVVAPEVGEFSWKDFYVRALLRMNEPSIEKKNNLNEVAEKVRHGEKLTWFRRMTTADIRRQFETAIRNHRPIAALIDEAQHFGKSRSVVRKMDNFDVIKSHANITATTLILFGTYELKELLYVGAQLSRRIEVIHFPRYRSSEEGLEEYAKTVGSFLKAIPLPLARSVSRDIRYYFRYSLGCTGILHTWLRKALERALKAGSKVLDQEHLDAARLSARQLEAIGEAIVEFELFFEHNLLDAVWLKLGLTQVKKDAASDTDKNKGKDGRKPGVRNPKRDPVGTK